MRTIWIAGLLLVGITAFGQKKDISLDDIWNSGTFYPKSIGGFTNLSDGKTYAKRGRDSKGNATLERFDYTTGNKIGVLVDGAKVAEAIGMPNFQFNSFQLNGDESKVLLTYASEPIYRHSTRSYFVVVNLADYSVVNFNKDKVRYPTMSPTSDQVAYVKDNDLYVYRLDKGKEKRMTKDGEQNSIINGAVDWVYEEEFGMSRGFEWNADGTKIAYYKFDESAVKEWTMPYYGSLYPYQYKYKYPKAGEDNSKVYVHICDVKRGKDKALELGSENDQYLPRIQWTKDPNVLSVQRLNRLQNHWELLMVDAKGQVSVAVEETSPQYVDIVDHIHFLEDGRHMILNSERNGYNHLYFHKVEGPQVFQITKGDWDVDALLGVDEAHELIYFTSSEVSAVERHIYSVGFDGKGKRQLSSGSGTHSAVFSTDYSMAMHTHSSMTGGTTYTLRNAAWEVLRVEEDNADFRAGLEAFNMSPVEFGQLDNGQGSMLNYYMIKPAQMDSGKQYPLFMYVYGGPGSQMVTNGYQYSNYAWFQMLASRYGIVVACVDNRGTGGRGATFKKQTYKQLGKLETEDQIAAARYFGAQDFIDAERIGIWGWSYGGYMSSLALAKGNDVFKMAIAVAPVTNWRYYDNIYTERFMQRPQENADGYDLNSPINFVQDIKGAYLIIHGTGDDNVHFQNTVEMVNALIEHNIRFDSEFYPDRNHGIYGGNTRYHLYDRMTRFILDEL